MESLKQLTTHINLEMSGDTKRYLVSAKQGDRRTRYIIAKLLNSGEPYSIPEGARAVINIKKPDGKHVYNACTYSGADVTVELTSQTLAASGTAYCDIEIRSEDDTQVITSASFTMEIEESQRNDNAILSSNEFTELEDRLRGYKEAEEGRAEAEKQRVEAEADRASAEAIRQENETVRVRQEQEREEAETARALAEVIRQENETDRVRNEQERKEAETARASAEIVRQENETVRTR